MKNFLYRLLIVALAVVSTASHAWMPDKNTTIEIVSGFPAGGTNYAVAQMFSEYIRASSGQQTIISIKPGAGGVVASNYFVSKAPDGSSVMLVVGLGMLVHPTSTTDNVQRHTLADFEPITIFGKTPSLLVTRADNLTKTMEQFVSLGSTKLSIGYTTATQELIARSLSKTLPNAVFVPYKSSGEVARDLISGSIDYAITTTSGSGQLIAAGRLAALGTTQTNGEFPEFDKKHNPLGRNFGAIVGVVLPKNTPKPITDFYVRLTKGFIDSHKDQLARIHMYLGDDEFGPKAFTADMVNLSNLIKLNDFNNK